MERSYRPIQPPAPDAQGPHANWPHAHGPHAPTCPRVTWGIESSAVPSSAVPVSAVPSSAHALHLEWDLELVEEMRLVRVAAAVDGARAGERRKVVDGHG